VLQRIDAGSSLTQRTSSQLVRAILQQAIEDGLVNPAEEQWDDPDPQERTDEELAGCVGVSTRSPSESPVSVQRGRVRGADR
jgi:hypothetical protein